MEAFKIDKKQFDELGFLVCRQAASSSTTSYMKTIATHHLENRTPPFELEADVGYPGAPETSSKVGGGTIRRLLQAYNRDPVFSSWAHSERVRSILGILLETDAFMLSRVHHNCIMTKQPLFSSETGWHRDIRYWAFHNTELISVWLALGKEHAENGGLKIIPGSHKMTFNKGSFDEKDFFRSQYGGNLLDRTVEVSLNQGDLLVFHSRTLHSAGWNRTSSAKWSLVFTYYHPLNFPVAGTRSASIDPVIIG